MKTLNSSLSAAALDKAKSRMHTIVVNKMTLLKTVLCLLSFNLVSSSEYFENLATDNRDNATCWTQTPCNSVLSILGRHQNKKRTLVGKLSISHSVAVEEEDICFPWMFRNQTQVERVNAVTFLIELFCVILQFKGPPY